MSSQILNYTQKHIVYSNCGKICMHSTVGLNCVVILFWTFDMLVNSYTWQYASKMYLVCLLLLPPVQELYVLKRLHMWHVAERYMNSSSRHVHTHTHTHTHTQHICLHIDCVCTFSLVQTHSETQRASVGAGACAVVGKALREQAEKCVTKSAMPGGHSPWGF